MDPSRRQKTTIDRAGRGVEPYSLDGHRLDGDSASIPTLRARPARTDLLQRMQRLHASAAPRCRSCHGRRSWDCLALHPVAARSRTLESTNCSSDRCRSMKTMISHRAWRIARPPRCCLDCPSSMPLPPLLWLLPWRRDRRETPVVMAAPSRCLHRAAAAGGDAPRRDPIVLARGRHGCDARRTDSENEARCWRVAARRAVQNIRSARELRRGWRSACRWSTGSSSTLSSRSPSRAVRRSHTTPATPAYTGSMSGRAPRRNAPGRSIVVKSACLMSRA